MRHLTLGYVHEGGAPTSHRGKRGILVNALMKVHDRRPSSRPGGFSSNPLLYVAIASKFVHTRSLDTVTF